MDLRFTEQDQVLLGDRGISVENVRDQIKRFREGLPSARLRKPCIIGDGIRQIRVNEHKSLLALHREAADSGRITKFVPASGAATRMFKSLLAALEEMQKAGPTAESIPTDVARFADHLDKFAFSQQLKRACGSDATPEKMLRTLLAPQGFNYATLPKGLIPFHKYDTGSRTAFEEHLVEGLAYARDADGKTRIHFTVSESYQEKITAFLQDVVSRYCEDSGSFDITYSLQHPSTDTIAVTIDNQPLRDKKNRLVFRPGGHGALLKNLDELEGDIVYIKNIDNVVPDHLKKTTILYKQLLGGLLVQLQNKSFQYLRAIEEDSVDRKLLMSALGFMRNDLQADIAESADSLSDQALQELVFEQLNRPMRICGMVKNEGEPGGGPFWVAGHDGRNSAQIVESAQVDMGDQQQQDIWQRSTHFNPVDLVCGIRDHHGKPYQLTKFRDPQSGFIAQKSFESRDIKALELPGLWNGAMAWWNTLFVEVPIITFNPVKTVFDLLRPEHQ